MVKSISDSQIKATNAMCQAINMTGLPRKKQIEPNFPSVYTPESLLVERKTWRCPLHGINL